jgi:RHS repeat-associated protein
VQNLVLEWTGGAQSKGLREIGLWGLGLPERNATDENLADRVLSDAAPGAITFPATPERGNVARVELGPAAPPSAGRSAVFHVALGTDPRSLAHAFLVYELTGLGSFVEPLRQINGLSARGGAIPTTVSIDAPSSGGLQVEEIAPAWLHSGDNEIRFLPLAGGRAPDYHVAHVRIVGTAHAAVREVRVDTGSENGKPIEKRLSFDVPSQPHDVVFELLRPAAGALLVRSPDAKGARPVRVDLRALDVGWHRADLGGLAPTDSLAIGVAPTTKRGARGPRENEVGLAISEVAVTASELPRDADRQRLVVTYPLHGECIEHQGRVRGFIQTSVAGTVTLRADGRSLDDALGGDRSFELTIPEPATSAGGGWEVPLEARLVDGTVLRRTVHFEPCLDPILRDDGLRAEDEGAPFGEVVRAGESKTIAFAGAKLEIPVGAVDRDTRITIRPLVESDVPKMGPRMANVSPEGRAFRFGPHGLKFKKPVKITLPYDPAALEPGMHERHVFGFYYDEPTGKWQRIGRYGIAAGGELSSLTEHFTDFLNSTLAMPDEPGPQSLDSNQFKGMQSASPLTDIDLIAPPQANSSGSARLTYPIEIPPGRQGVEPQLAVAYDSDRKNGWMGLGWDLSLSRIEVDTRFGVPLPSGSDPTQFDGKEIYLLDGSALTAIDTNRTQFQRRVEGRFDQIQHVGKGAGSTWVVTDKHGTQFTYGEVDSSTGNQNVLAPRDGSGAINGPVSTWYLTSAQDTFGNRMVFHYVLKQGTLGDSISNVPWVQMYPASIDYTSNVNVSGSDGSAHYHVVFTLDGTRVDQFSSARTGFLVLTDQRLSRIDVTFDGATTETIRSYHFNYEVGAFEKSRLHGIEMFGLDGTSKFYEHSFGYTGVSTSSDGILQGFAGPTQWTSSLSTDSFASSNSSEGGLSGYVGIGPATGCFPHAGLGGGFSTGSDSTTTALADVNGDGLPDLVDTGGSSPLLLNTPAKGFGSGSFSASSFSFPSGFNPGSADHQSASLDLAAHFFNELLGAGINHNWTWQNEDSAFQDLNGDGFPDVIGTGGATLLHGLGATQSSSTTAGSSTNLTDPTVASQLDSAFYATSVLVRWQAPITGNLTITGAVSQASSDKNGIKTSIIEVQEPQPKRAKSTSTLWSRSVNPGDAACTPSGTQDCGSGITTSVIAGDRLYFLVDPVGDISSDAVTWAPTVTYTTVCSDSQCSQSKTLSSQDLKQKDSFGLPMFVYSQPGDFRISDPEVPGWIANSDGVVVVDATVSTPTSFDLQLLQKNADTGAVTKVVDKTIPSGQTTLDTTAWTTSVTQGDTLFFNAVLSANHIDPGSVTLQPVMRYTQVCGTDGVRTTCRSVQSCDNASVQNPQCTLQALQNDRPGSDTVPEVAIERPAEVSDSSTLSAGGPTTTAFTVPRDGTVALQGTIDKEQTTAPVGLVVSRGGLDLFKDTIASAAIDPPASEPTTTVTFDVKAGDSLVFTELFATLDDEIDLMTLKPRVTWAPVLVYQDNQQSVTVSSITPIVSSPGGTDAVRMMGGFRGWAYGEWTTQYTPFNEDDFQAKPNDPNATPDQRHAVHFTPVSPHWENVQRQQPVPLNISGPVWTGSGADMFIGLDGSGNPLWKPSRVGGVSPESMGASPALNKSLSSMTSGSVSGVASLDVSDGSTESQRQLVDLNGDRRPDVLQSGHADFQSCAGSLCDGSQDGDFSSLSQTMNMNGGAPRHVDNHNVHFGIGFGSAASAIAQKAEASSTTKAVLSVLPSLGQSYGASNTSDDTVDINGDGLPDYVQSDGSGNFMVGLNMGYGFAQLVPWPLGTWTTNFNGDPNIPQQNASPSLNPLQAAKNPVLAAISALDSISSAPFEDNFTPDILRFEDSVTDNLQVGYAGIGGGVAYSATRTLVDFVDVNGDGLPDRVLRQPDSDVLWVRLNLGNGFAPAQQWSFSHWTGVSLTGTFTSDINGSNDALSFSETTSFNAGVGFPLLIPIPVAGICLSIEISATLGNGNGAAQMTWADVDGDGALDHVLKPKGQNQPLLVRLNQTSKANLLTTVTRPLGGSFTLDYKREGNVAPQDKNGYRVDMPTNQYVLSNVTVHDAAGVQQDISETFAYEDPTDGTPSGFYDRTEREGYGYHFVTTTRAGDGSRQVQVFDTSDYYHRGELLSTVEMDSSGRLFTKTDVLYQLLGSTPPPTLTGTFFPREKSRTTSFYEGTTTDPTAPGKTTTQTRTFDDSGNLTDLVDQGDVGTADDIAYHVTYDPTLQAQHILKPKEVTAKDAAGNLLRDRSATYDSRGAMLSATNIVTGGTDPTGQPYSGTPATYQFTVDTFGNLTQAVDPRGYTLHYVFDGVVNTFRAATTDSFGYTSTTAFDFRFGLALSSTDVNGNVTQFAYDPFGRISTVDAPADVGQSEHTIAFCYSQLGTSAAPNGCPATSNPIPAFATTAHKDVQHPNDSIVTSSFIDGIGHIIQTKKDLDKDTGTGPTTGMSVSGAVAFDKLGRLTSQGQPTFDASTDPTKFVTTAMVNPTVFTHDIMGRATSVQTPDGSVTTTTYGFDTLPGDSTVRLVTTVADPNVNADISSGGTFPGTSVESFRDVRENVLAVKESNHLSGATPTTIVTRYAYDPVDELLQVTDAKNNVTTATYDTVGRMVALKSPDAGLSTYSYDLSGNLGAKQTAKLRANSQRIQYTYNFNRLQQITYPQSPPVVYTYGDASEAGETGFNRAGRVKQETSEAVTKTYEYDALGNIVEQSWSLNSLRPPQTGTIDESMNYTYDSFGRLLTIVFPGSDNEAVTYGYDHGGNVTSAVGVDNTGGVTNYLLAIGYDEFEQRERVVSGNGVQTSYVYEPLMRRLTQINSDQRDPTLVKNNRPARPMQRMRYTYDPAGNITQERNDAPFDPSLGPQVMLGPVTQNFTYDDLYQLKTAGGVYQEESKDERVYGLSFTYDPINNVLVKQQTSDLQKLNGGGKAQPVHDQTYTSTFTYGGTQPHAPTEVDDQLVAPPKTVPRVISYDASGNQTSWVIGQTTSDQRVTTFDEENRITTVFDQGHNLSQVLYDGSGERAVRLHLAGGEEEAAYFGPNLTVRDGDIPTKHIFAGPTRIATKVGNNGNQAPTTLYFHDDHLGSTNFLTDDGQELVDHQEYFPTGELWVDETEDPLHLNQPYLFNGKEFDVETGLYYFGARYYDPRLSMWNSPDPALKSYLQEHHGAQMQRPENLGLYTYAWNRPTLLRDPTGRSVWSFAYDAFTVLVRTASNALVPAATNALLGFLVGGPAGAAAGFLSGLHSQLGNALGATVTGALGTLGFIHGMRMASAETYHSAEGFLAFLLDNTWSVHNSLVGSVYATVMLGDPVNVNKSRGTGQLYLTNQLGPPYDTTFGNVTTGTAVPRHEATHAWQARLFGPAFYPLNVAFYAINTVAPWWLIPKALGAWSNLPIRNFGEYFTRGVYPFVPFETWAYAVEGSPQ